jgi:hypothetical protein
MQGQDKHKETVEKMSTRKKRTAISSSQKFQGLVSNSNQ